MLNSFQRDGSPGLDDNRLTSGLMRLTYPANSRNKFSAYLDRIRKERNHEQGEGEDVETAAQFRRPVLYYTVGAKWTGTLTNRMLAEFGYSVNGEVFPRDYQAGIGQERPTTDIGCFSTPCFPAVGSSAHLAQTQGGQPLVRRPWRAVRGEAGRPAWLQRVRRQRARQPDRHRQVVGRPRHQAGRSVHPVGHLPGRGPA